MDKKLTLSSTEKKISGVCGGIAEYMNIDPTLVRIAWIIITLFTIGFGGVILYIALAFIMPKSDEGDQGYQK